MKDLIQNLRTEAARNARLQGDKGHQTNRRRKTFRYRNHILTKAANLLEQLVPYTSHELGCKWNGKPIAKWNEFEVIRQPCSCGLHDLILEK